MEVDDPRQPLLGRPSHGTFRRVAGKLCSLESWKRRLPITIWLPQYKLDFLIRDVIAGVTVGLTSIPQGIAYAIIAGLPPQVGLYSSIFPGLVYTLFGSRKEVTVGPTAILSALLAKYVAQSEDFAYLAAFLSGCIILLLGVLQLGFLLDFMSKPVISGFTTAAALQIAASQLKSLFRLAGSSGNTFIDAMWNLFTHIKTVQPWDTLLGVATIAALLLLKAVPSRRAAWRHVSRARNALVVVAGAVLAYLLHLHDLTPFALTGKIEGGLPRFGPPPFSTVVNNRTLHFDDMLKAFGPEGFVMPLIAILESIAIAKAFAGSSPVDATQEMVAVGLCNVIAAFTQAAPAAGSFTRTALNHASGVRTPAGSFFKACLVLLAVTLMTDAFYFIPRATLAAIIIVAMMSIVEISIIRKLWRNSKCELCTFLVTVVSGAWAGLELGAAVGAACDALRALAAAARPTLQARGAKIGHQDCVTMTLLGTLSYASAQYVPQRVQREVQKHSHHQPLVVVLDGRHLHAIDFGVAENLITVILDLEKQHHRFLLWNFTAKHQALFEDLQPDFGSRFVNGPSIDQHVLGLEIDRRNVTVNSF